MLAYDVTTLIVDDPVKRVDNMTMAWGLEARVPFLDQELVRAGGSMPPALKLSSGGKYPLKMIARDLLPDTVIDRPKGYFPVPSLKFVRGKVLEFMREVLNSAPAGNVDCFSVRMWTTLLENPEGQHTRSRAASYGTWPCLSSGCSAMSINPLEWLLYFSLSGLQLPAINQ